MHRVLSKAWHDGAEPHRDVSGPSTAYHRSLSIGGRACGTSLSAQGRSSRCWLELCAFQHGAKQSAHGPVSPLGGKACKCQLMNRRANSARARHSAFGSTNKMIESTTPARKVPARAHLFSPLGIVGLSGRCPFNKLQSGDSPQSRLNLSKSNRQASHWQCDRSQQQACASAGRLSLRLLVPRKL